MWKLIKENRKLLILTAIALLAGIVIGMLIGLNMEQPSQAAGRIGTKSVLPATRMLRNTYYTGCAHVTEQAIDAAAFVGYTEAELAAFYASDHVLTFTAEEVLLIRTVGGCCSEHWILKCEDGKTLTVRRTDPDTLMEKTVQILDASLLAELPKDALPLLKDGIVFDALHEIDSYLESIGS